MSDILGAELKAIEHEFTNVRIDKTHPVYVRLDGRAFHTFTRGFNRPFDPILSEIMVQTTEALVKEFKADLGYTQSDEISLLWLPKGEESQFIFDGKIQKLTSVLASFCSVTFYRHCLDHFQVEKLPTFDCRILNISDYAKMFKWRQLDARKNAISMAGHYYLGHKTCMHKNSGEKIELLKTQHNINFDDYPDFFKNGTFVEIVNVERELSAEELLNIPEKYKPSGPVIRSETKRTYTYDFI